MMTNPSNSRCASTGMRGLGSVPQRHRARGWRGPGTACPIWRGALLALLSGLALCFGTAWGVFRHYWVASKLVMTVFATGVLLAYMSTFREMAGIAGDSRANLVDVRNPSPLVHGILALALLLAATWLAVYKPFGVTPYGRRARAFQANR